MYSPLLLLGRDRSWRSLLLTTNPPLPLFGLLGCFCLIIIAAGFFHARTLPGSRIMAANVEQQLLQRAKLYSTEFYENIEKAGALPPKLTSYEKQATHLRLHLYPRNVSLCVAIRSLPRKGGPTEQYLPLTVAGLLRGLSTQDRQAVYIAVVNGAIDHEDHPAAFAVEPFVDELVLLSPDLIEKKRNIKFIDDQRLSLGLPKLIPGDGALGRLDWQLAAESCLTHTTAEHILIIEDDVFAYRSWFTYLSQHLLPQLAGRQWFRIDLFHIDSWRGWETSETILLIGCCLLLSIPIVLLVILRCGVRQTRLGASSTFSMNVLFLAIFFFAGFAPLWWMNAMNVLPAQQIGLHPILGKICCAQAYMFNRNSLQLAIDLRIKSLEMPLETDRLINNLTRSLRDEEHIPSYFSYPSIFQHVGVQTVIDNHDRLIKLSTTFEYLCRDDGSSDLLTTIDKNTNLIWSVDEE